MPPLRLLPALLAALAACQVATQPADNVDDSVPRRPPASREHVMLYDPRQEVVLMLGGRTTDDVVIRSIWQWDGSHWAFRGLVDPLASINPAVAYDSARAVLVLQGGFDISLSPRSETWELAAGKWTKKLDDGGPSRRGGHSAVYEAARRRVLLYGGGGDPIGETWSWDGAQWTRLAITGPGPLTYTAMTYDASRGETVLFGGAPAGPGAGGGSSATWIWNGTSWRAGPATGPPARSRHAMAYDAKRRVIVLFGGASSTGTLLNDTWEWDGAAWRRIAPAISPGARQSHAIAYDGNSQEIVMYGGWDGSKVLEDFWSYSGTVWFRRPLTRAAR